MDKESELEPVVTIRRLDRANLEIHFGEFLALFAENTRGHVTDQSIGDDYILSKAKEIFEYLDRGKAILFTAWRKNRLAGFLWAYPRVFLQESRLYINALIVAEEFRGQRIGKMLVRELEAYARANGIPAIDVQTASFKNDAIHFYEQLGYRHERVQLRKALDVPPEEG